MNRHRSGLPPLARPVSIVLFDRFFLSARFLSIVPILFDGVRRIWNGEPSPDPQFTSTTTAIYYVVMVSPALPPLLFWYFASLRASIIAKWLLSAFVAYEAVAVIGNLFYFNAEGRYQLLFYAVVGLLDLTAIVMLHRSDSRTWFKLRGRFGGIDPKTFV